ncbi:VOC family protein [Marinobacterium arenosum]|uniref:VOC family protein n=1 Tax=Marinobacterium arenosum TaxID=2862496 RepID=UPI001C94D186|nr:VOC family protein [Marinobacterium arenosum]MBY4678578.1 VOC family protein [Marinobacterium arenosum]
MDKITPNLWFDGNAEDAANFYVGLFPDSRIDAAHHAPSDNPSTAKGAVLLVQFTLAGRHYTAINGGPQFPFTEAVSFQIDCQDQAEVDRYWQALIADGGSPGQCGWCKDRFGLSWQVVPRRLSELLSSDNRAAAERTMQSMLKMTKLDVAAPEAAHKEDRGEQYV